MKPLNVQISSLLLLTAISLCATPVQPAPAYAYWLDDVRLTYDSAASETSPGNGWCVAADTAGNLCTVWTDLRDGQLSVYSKHYNGAAWTADERLSDESAPSDQPSIAGDGLGNFHVVWTDYESGTGEIYYRKSDGTSWEPAVRLTTDPANSLYPTVAADDSGGVHVVWQEYRDGDWEIYYKCFDGTSWGADTRLTASAGISGYPCIAVDAAGHLHIVWHDSREGSYEIYYKFFDGAWGEDQRLTVAAGVSGHPSIAADGLGNLHVLWEDERNGSYQIFHKMYDGVAWGSDELLSSVAEGSTSPSVAADDSGHVHVVWQAAGPLLTPLTTEIYYKFFNGIDWDPEVRLTNAYDASDYASVCLNPRGDVHVVWQDARDGNFEIYWKWAFTSPLPGPEVFSITPDSCDWDTVVHITDLAGDHFLGAASVWLQMMGRPDVVASNVTVVSPTQITCDFDLTGAPSGWWDVVVENPDAQKDTLVAGFWVIPLPTPEITSITPDSGYWDTVVHITDLAGDHFFDGASVWLQMTGEPDVVASDVTVLSPAQVTCDFDLTGVAGGWWDVVVENPDAQKDTLAGAFWVGPFPKPEIFSIEPDSGYWDTVVHITDLAGDHFRDSASVWLQMMGESDVVASNVTVLSPAQVTCDFDLAGAPFGWWDVVVENPDTQKDTLAEGFRVIPVHKPEIFSIEPDSGYWDTSVHVTDLAGNHFFDGASVWLQMTGQPDVIASNVTVLSPAQITCDFDLTGVADGWWDVVVENLDTQKDTLAEGFRVIPMPKPEVISIEPDSSYPLYFIHITDLAGNHFFDGAQVRLQKPGEADIEASNVTVVSSNQITCDFCLWDAAGGWWDIVVENLDAQKDTLVEGYQIVPRPTPEITSIEPDSGYWNSVVGPATITGSGFMSLAWVWLQKLGQPKIDAYNVTTVSPNEITCYFDLTGVAYGWWDVVVTNVGGTRDTLVAGFRVVPWPKPEIASITPDSAYWYSIVHITDLRGDYFVDGASVWLQMTGQPHVIASDVTVMSPAQITCDFDLTGVAEGWWDVVVRNVDTQKDTLASGFQVMPRPKPEIFSIEPDSGYWDTVVHITDLSGDHFLDAASVWFQMTGQPHVVASDVTVLSPGQITCDFDLTGAAEGLWDVVVENFDTQKDTLVGGFRVMPQPKPEIFSIDPSLWPRDHCITAEISGSGFCSGTQVWLQRAGEYDIYPSDITVVSPALLTCDLDLTAAALGCWDVVAQNSGTPKDTLDCGFLVLASLWEDETRLTSTADSSRTSRANARCIAVDGLGNVHVVWWEDREYFNYIYYRSFDGVAWSPELQLDFGFSQAGCPSIAGDSDNNLHVVWRDDRFGDTEISYMKYDGAWSPGSRLTYAEECSSFPNISAGPANSLHVVWQDDRTGNLEIYYKSHEGLSWTADQRLTVSAAASILPTVAVDGSCNVHVAWLEYRGAASDTLLYLKSDGVTWGTPVALDTAVILGAPSMAAYGDDNVCITWHASHSSEDQTDIYFRRYDGITWQPKEMLTTASGRALDASVAVDDSGLVYVVWSDDRSGEDEIYFKRFDGIAWEPDTRLTNVPYYSGHPSAALGGGRDLNIIWTDSRDGNCEIYYRKRNPGDLAGVNKDDVGKDRPLTLGVFPNPVKHGTEIRFCTGAQIETVLSVYDISGRLVWKHNMGLLQPGQHNLKWPCTDHTGRRVCAGVYFLSLKIGPSRSTAKIVVLK